MFQSSGHQAIMIFPIILGSFAILLGLLNKQILHLIGLKTRSELFTTPRFQQSAKITDILERVFLVVFGIGFLFQGIGPQFLADRLSYTISMVILGLSGLIILAIFGVVLAHWKP